MERKRAVLGPDQTAAKEGVKEGETETETDGVEGKEGKKGKAPSRASASPGAKKRRAR